MDEERAVTNYASTTCTYENKVLDINVADKQNLNLTRHTRQIRWSLVVKKLSMLYFSAIIEKFFFSKCIDNFTCRRYI